MSDRPVDWMRRWLLVAAAYNLAFGAYAVLFPNHYFVWVGLEPPRYPQLWQCVGMIVGVYGLGYAIAARDPLRHWPIVFVGLAGKVLGPVGFLWSLVEGALPWKFGWILLSNDLLWWVPFAMILWRAFAAAGAPRDEAESDLEEVLRSTASNVGLTLAEHSRHEPTLVVCLRHFGCTFCKEALADLREERVALERGGTRLLFVHMSDEDTAREVFRQAGLGDVPRVSDPTARVYRALGLRRGSFVQLFGWRTWLRGLQAIRRGGHGVGRLAGDGFRLPGVFLLRDECVLKAHRHRDASEVPDYADLATCPVEG